MSKGWTFWLLIAGFPGLAFSLDPQALLEQMDEALAPDRYHAVIEMKTVKPDRSTQMTFDLLYRRGTGSLMELLAPARVKGTKLLQKDEGLWLYSPSSGSSRPLRLSPKQPFQGSVFSNGDVSEPHFSRDYRASLSDRQTLDVSGLGSVEALVLDALPQTRQAQYGRLRIWMQAESHLPLKIEYTAKSGLLFKRMEFSDFRPLGGAVRPATYRMESFEEPGTYTILSFTRLEARTDLSESLFTENGLTR